MTETYLNPVYPHSAPDPFVLKFCGAYWAYTTGIQPDGRAFGILHSPDLVHWQPRGSALDLLPGDHTCYWAPEVSYLNGVFYMYYSVGNEENMEIRAATSSAPDGPFVDAGRRLTQEPFAIDAHIFQDEDGSRYLFYATDFLDGERVGTATVMDRMLDPFTLSGEPRPVTRARYDWQIYDPARVEKGGVCWHTVEGPFVIKHQGRYYQMFSGGNWKNTTYGVGYAQTDNLDTPGEWEQACDGERILPILRSRPELGVIGPGHNSVVRGLDNQELFCIYHRWQPEIEERVLAIDRMGWEGDGLRIYGPTTTPQPAPRSPLFSGFGAFILQRGASPAARLEPDSLSLPPNAAAALAVYPSAPHDLLPAFVLEVSLRAQLTGDYLAGGELGVYLGDGLGHDLRLALAFPSHEMQVRAGEHSTNLPLMPDFHPAVFHLLRIEGSPHQLRVELDSQLVYDGELPLAGLGQVSLFAAGLPAQFAGFGLTGSPDTG